MVSTDLPNKSITNSNPNIKKLVLLVDKIINGISYNYNKNIIIINNKINKKSIPIFGSIIDCFKSKLNINIPIHTAIIFIIYQPLFYKNLKNFDYLNFYHFNNLLQTLKQNNCIDNKSLIDINNILIKLNSNDFNDINTLQNKIQNIINVFNNINTELCINNNMNPQIILARYFLFISILINNLSNNDNNDFKNTFTFYTQIIEKSNQIKINFVPNEIKIKDNEINIFNIHKISEISTLETGFCTYNFIGTDYILKNLLGNVSKIAISYTSKQNFGTYSELPTDLKITTTLFYSQFIDPYLSDKIILNKPAINFNSYNDITINDLNSNPRNAIIDTNIKNGIFNFNLKGDHINIDFKNISYIPKNKGAYTFYLGNDIPNININPIYIYKSSILNYLRQSKNYSYQSYSYTTYSSSNLEPGFKESSYFSFSFKNINISFNIIKVIQFRSDPNNNIIINKITLYIIPSLSPFKYFIIPNNRNDGFINITSNTYDLENFIKKIDGFNRNNIKLSQDDKLNLIKFITYLLSHFDKFITIY